ncbi:hypothetical protein GGR50DRAFT_10804 [Xylaria sp. CBS 124048]|nr:hypothetical protein GGR50DRAFT_10804 [Xylaria sp. CBS 124048]
MSRCSVFLLPYPTLPYTTLPTPHQDHAVFIFPFIFLFFLASHLLVCCVCSIRHSLHRITPARVPPPSQVNLSLGLLRGVLFRVSLSPLSCVARAQAEGRWVTAQMRQIQASFFFLFFFFFFFCVFASGVMGGEKYMRRVEEGKGKKNKTNKYISGKKRERGEKGDDMFIPHRHISTY